MSKHENNIKKDKSNPLVQHLNHLLDEVCNDLASNQSKDKNE